MRGLVWVGGGVVGGVGVVGCCWGAAFSGGEAMETPASSFCRSAFLFASSCSPVTLLLGLVGVSPGVCERLGMGWSASRKESPPFFDEEGLGSGDVGVLPVEKNNLLVSLSLPLSCFDVVQYFPFIVGLSACRYWGGGEEYELFNIFFSCLIFVISSTPFPPFLQLRGYGGGLILVVCFHHFNGAPYAGFHK